MMFGDGYGYLGDPLQRDEIGSDFQPKPKASVSLGVEPRSGAEWGQVDSETSVPSDPSPPPTDTKGDFKKFFKFGLVDNGLLILMTVAGVGFDDKIAKALDVPPGWGPLIGASVGNAISDGVAGMADGPKAAAGVALGAALPIVPIFLAANVMKKKPKDKTAQILLMASSAAMVAWAYRKKR